MRSLGWKKVQDCDYIFRSSTTFQRRQEWICESRCQVSDRLHVFAFFFASASTVVPCMLGLRFTRSLQSSFFILHPAYVLPQSSVCILSQVRSLRFTLTGRKITTNALNHLSINSVFSYCPGRGGGGVLKEFLGGDVPLGPWNP